jgi:hypothetical protein
MTWAEIMLRAAVINNDSAQGLFTNAALLPYLNISLSELEEIFELNNIPSTNETSATIAVPAATTVIGFSTIPALPADLIEIQQLFESPTGQNIWIPMTKRNYLTPSLPGVTPVSVFGVWAWMEQEIRVPSAVTAIDLKIDYIRSLFAEIVIGGINAQNTILNSDTFLYFRIAGLSAEFIGENPTRAASCNANAEGAISRSLGISVKGQQSIQIRRRPFRAAFKRYRTIA